jgi:hypothetical protein
MRTIFRHSRSEATEPIQSLRDMDCFASLAMTILCPPARSLVKEARDLMLSAHIN